MGWGGVTCGVVLWQALAILTLPNTHMSHTCTLHNLLPKQLCHPSLYPGGTPSLCHMATPNISHHAVRGLVEQILKFGRVMRPVLGITIAPPQV